MSHKLLLWTQEIFTTVHLWAQDMLSEMLMRDWLMSGLRCIHVLFTSYKAEKVSEKYSPLKVKLKGMFENSVESEIGTCACFHPKEEYLCQKTRIGRMLAPITLNWFVVHFKILVFQRITRESVFNLLQTALFIFLHFIQTYWSIVLFHIYNNFYKLDFEVSIENYSKKTCENHTAKFQGNEGEEWIWVFKVLLAWLQGFYWDYVEDDKSLLTVQFSRQNTFQLLLHDVITNQKFIH